MLGGTTQQPSVTVNPLGYGVFFNNGGQTGIGAWDVSNVTSMNSMFIQNTGFNQPIAGWNVGKVTDMNFMFYMATEFNQPIGSWNTSSVTSMQSTFAYASGFDQNIGSWDVTKVNNFSNFMRGMSLSTANYDALLNGWGPQNVKNNKSIDFGSSQYSSSTYWRNHLINSQGWTITDGGQA